MSNSMKDIEVDGIHYCVTLSPESFEDGEYVHYQRQTHTVEVSQGLAPHRRMSLVVGVLLAEIKRASYQRAAANVMAPGIYERLRDGLGAARQRGDHGYKLITTPWDLDVCFGVHPEFSASRVVEPGDEGLVVCMDGDMPEPMLALWGVEGSIASESTGPGDEFWSLNVQTHRCMVPATGWFDFMSQEPVMYQLSSASLFAFAGIWGRVKGLDDEPRLVFTVLTTESIPGGRGGADSMPVVLAPDEYAPWLDPASDASGLIERVRRPWPKNDIIQMGLG